MKNINLLELISRTENFMTLQDGVKPTLTVNIQKYDANSSQFRPLRDYFDIIYWDTLYNFMHSGAIFPNVINTVDENILKAVRQLDMPLFMLEQVIDNKMVVYSSKKGMDSIYTFFNNHSQFKKDDFHIILL